MLMWNLSCASYQMQDSAKVLKKKGELAKTTNAEVTKRQKLTSYISTVLKSRQEEAPYLYISGKIYLVHMCLLKLNLFQIFQKTIFSVFVTFVRKEMKLNKLAGKMITWFNETNSGVYRDFKYRFTGRESNAFLKYFPVLFSKFIRLVDDARVKKRFLQYFYQLIHVRKLISYLVRLTNFNHSDLEEMLSSGKKLFKASCLSGTSISPSIVQYCTTPCERDIDLVWTRFGDKFHGSS